MKNLNTGMMSGIKNLFRIGERVSHKTSEDVIGIVLDISHSQLNDRYTYLIAVGFGGEYVCQEHELNKEE